VAVEFFLVSIYPKGRSCFGTVRGLKNLSQTGRASAVIKLPPGAFASGWRRHVQAAKLKASRPCLCGFFSTPAPVRSRAGAACVDAGETPMVYLKPEPTLTEAINQTHAVLRQTLRLAKKRQRARKEKPTEEEKLAVEALVELLWDCHTEAAGIAYRMGMRG